MKITELNPKPIPLDEGIDPPAERLPEPHWIEVTREEYDTLMGYNRKTGKYE